MSAADATLIAKTVVAAEKCITCTGDLVLTEANVGDGFGTCASDAIPSLTEGCIAAVATPGQEVDATC